MASNLGRPARCCVAKTDTTSMRIRSSGEIGQLRARRAHWRQPTSSAAARGDGQRRAACGGRGFRLMVQALSGARVDHSICVGSRGCRWRLTSDAVGTNASMRHPVARLQRRRPTVAWPRVRQWRPACAVLLLLLLYCYCYCYCCYYCVCVCVCIVLCVCIVAALAGCWHRGRIERREARKPMVMPDAAKTSSGGTKELAETVERLRPKRLPHRRRRSGPAAATCALVATARAGDHMSLPRRHMQAPRHARPARHRPRGRGRSLTGRKPSGSNSR